MRSITEAYKDMLIRLSGEGKRGQSAWPGGQTGKTEWATGPPMGGEALTESRC